MWRAYSVMLLTTTIRNVETKFFLFYRCVQIFRTFSVNVYIISG